MADGEGFFHSEGRFHFPHHHQGHVDPPARPPAQLNGEIIKIFCQAGPDFNLAVRHHEVVLVPGDENDPYQTWIKDESWSTKVKDSAGFPAFALINRGTGKALRHAEGAEAPVLLEEYEPNVLNEVILWTASADVGDGYRAIRPVNNIHLNLDADHGAEKYGGVKDGNKVILFKWKNETNQHWHMATVEQRYDHHSRPQEYGYEHYRDQQSPFLGREHEHHGDFNPSSHERRDHHHDHHSPRHEFGHEHRPDHHSREREYEHHGYSHHGY